MKHYRTIPQAAAEIAANDPATAITPWALRTLVRSGAIPSVRRGNRYLVALEDIEEYLSKPSKASQQKHWGRS